MVIYPRPSEQQSLFPEVRALSRPILQDAILPCLKKNAKNVRFTKENSCTSSTVVILKDCALVEARQI
ncbi:MAG TPA: hypothetical protein VKF36_18480 [Syntrophorhabdales bacterium]|nr:hypothetical protein [Syntrophorhabdales bacterium]